MGILERLKQLDEDRTSTDHESPSKFDRVKDDLVGLRRRVQEAPPSPFQNTQVAEPDDYEFQATDRFSEQQLRSGAEFLNQHLPNQQQELFRRDAGIDINDTYLRSLAKMAIASLKLKSNIISQPIRIAAGFAFKFVDKPEIADKISKIQIDDDLENLEELLVEVKFQELKALQRVDNLRIPKAEELLAHRNWMLGSKIAGEGFENIEELLRGLFDKFSKKKT
jgi:hypothetical protein